MSVKVILYGYNDLKPGITVQFNGRRVFYYYNTDNITVILGIFKYYGRI